jgi:iron complex transport system ATP-binding protein
VHAQRSLTVVMVLHDLAQAARYAHRLVVVHEGIIAADGPATVALTPRLLRDVFGVHARLVPDDQTTAPLLAYDHPTSQNRV